MKLDFADLSAGYKDQLDGVVVLNERKVRYVAETLTKYKARYTSVSTKASVPIAFIAAVHERESDANFNTYLGNGQPLHRRTTEVPRGRGPFKTWEAGAIDSLQPVIAQKIALPWSMERLCYEFERWNGWGYRLRHQVASPYLWASTNRQVVGKYISDGHWDHHAWDHQLGCAAIVLELFEVDPDFKAGIT